jgi:microcystin-dependent protein
MAEPFVGEIRLFAGNYAPVGWFFCDGSVLPISQYDVLYSLIGTTYGGDGQNTFALPDLRGRVPIHISPTLPLGMSLGTETVTLSLNQIPQHTHAVMASSAPGGPNPSGAYFANDGASAVYNAPDGTLMNPGMIGVTGGSQPHSNLMPFLCVSFIMAYEGIYPARN